MPAYVDATLLEELQAIGKTCESVPGEDRVRCAGSKNWSLVNEFLARRRDRATAVGALAEALGDAEPGVRGLATAVLRSAFASGWGRDPAPGKVSPEAARALLLVVLRQPAGVAKQALPAAVNAAMLAGQAELVHSELTRSHHAGLRASAYPHLMTFGRLGELPRVKRVVGEPAVDTALAALEAPLHMNDWSEAEQQVICEWSEGLLADQRPEIVVKAQLLLASCSGAWLDRVLARAEEVAARNQLDLTAQGPLIAMCNPVRRAQPLRATEPQCARARATLEHVARSARAEASARGHAAHWLGQLWPDDATKALLERLRRDKQAEVATKALEALQAMSEAAAAAQASR